MDSDQIAQIMYFVLLGAAIGGAVMMQGRRNIGRMAQQLAIWLLIFLGALAGYGLWDNISTTVIPRQSVIAGTGQVVLPRASDGHYYVTATVQGVPVRFVVDTGATNLVLSPQDARRIGINPDSLAYIGQAYTANGTVHTARVRLTDVALGDFTDTRVSADVNQTPMDSSLLGMSYLQKFGKIEITGNKMVLTR